MSTETGSGNDTNTLFEELGRLQSEWDRQERAGPPELLDQAVLNAARRDLAPVSRGKRLRWISGFATAGVAVIALSVLLLQESPQNPLPLPSEALMEEAPAESRTETGKPFSSPVMETGKQAFEAMPAAQPPGTRAASKAAPAAAAAPEPEHTRDLVARMRAAEQPKNEILELSESADSTLSPEAWLEVLLNLQEQEETEELARQLQAFRAAYPDYPLPDALTD